MSANQATVAVVKSCILGLMDVNVCFLLVNRWSITTADVVAGFGSVPVPSGDGESAARSGGLDSSARRFPTSEWTFAIRTTS